MARAMDDCVSGFSGCADAVEMFILGFGQVLGQVEVRAYDKGSPYVENQQLNLQYDADCI